MAENVQSTAEKTLSFLDKVREYKVYLSMVCFALYLDILFVTLTGRNLAEFDWPFRDDGGKTVVIKLGAAGLWLLLYSFLMAVFFKFIWVVSRSAINGVWWSVTVQGCRGWPEEGEKRRASWLHLGYADISEVEDRALQEKDSFLQGLVSARRAEVTASVSDMESLAQKSFAGGTLFLIDWFLPGGKSITVYLAETVTIPGVSGNAGLLVLLTFISVAWPWYFTQFRYDDSWESVVKYPPMAAETRDRIKRNRGERLRREAEERRVNLKESIARRETSEEG